jgi:hypothetical protein
LIEPPLRPLPIEFSDYRSLAGNSGGARRLVTMALRIKQLLTFGCALAFRAR